MALQKNLGRSGDTDSKSIFAKFLNLPNWLAIPVQISLDAAQTTLTDWTIPGGTGGGIIWVRGYEGTTGQAFSRLYLVSTNIPGGATTMSVHLFASSGHGVPSYTFDNNGGFLRITRNDANTHGAASIIF